MMWEKQEPMAGAGSWGKREMILRAMTPWEENDLGKAKVITPILREERKSLYVYASL